MPMMVGLLLVCGLVGLVVWLCRAPGKPAASAHCAGCRCFPPAMAEDAVVEDAPAVIPPKPRAPRKRVGK